jgi:hypothetical protein
MSLSDCQTIWLSSGTDLRVSCYELLSVQPSPSLAYFAREEFGFEEVDSLFDLYFGCNFLTEQDSQALDSFYVHSPTALESSLDGGLSHGLFLSTDFQLKWILDSTSSLLQLRAHQFIDENTLSVMVYFITRSLGRDQLFYTMNEVTLTLDTDGSIQSEVQTVFVPIVGYQYGYGGYPWLFQDVFLMELILGVLFLLFTLRETYQLMTWRVIPLCRWLSSSSSPVPSSVEGPPSPEQIQGQRSRQLQSLATHLQKMGSFLDGDGDEGPNQVGFVDEYESDGKLYHDFLDWVTVAAILSRFIFRWRYVTEASALHAILTKLEEENDFSSHTKQIAGFFRSLHSLDASFHLLSIAVVFVVTLQFFRYLSFDPRCRIIVTTLQTSLSGLLPVLTIFLVILIAYAVIASGIYGIVIPEYATYDSSLAALFLMLLGDWNYTGRKCYSPPLSFLTLSLSSPVLEVSSIETQIFFWSFVVLLSFILLNMVIAIIFTTYDQIARQQRELAAAAKDAAKKRQ